jgi:hypothetical protein
MGQGANQAIQTILADTALGNLLAQLDLQPHPFGSPPPPPLKRRHGPEVDKPTLTLPSISLERRLAISTDTDNLVVTHVTPWDPLQSLRGPSGAFLGDEWSLPLHQARQSPLPHKHGFTVAHNLALALQFFGSTSLPSLSNATSTTSLDFGCIRGQAQLPIFHGDDAMCGCPGTPHCPPGCLFWLFLLPGTRRASTVRRWC